ncbi:MAG: diguanylate cyclase [Betaproteobacteria bacterium]|nr:diguanylate cyclase [Betaproteobacteria bacterium]
MSYRLSIFLSSLALAAAFAATGFNLYGQVDEYFETELANHSVRFQNVFTTLNEALAQRAQALAYSIAANTEIQRLLVEASEAVHIARERNGNNNNARAKHVRQALRKQMERQWNELRARHEMRHLQFLLPDGTSFLRMDAPAYFGDVSTAVRPMLAGIVQDRKPRSGFEIEHTYAGILGMAVVSHHTPDVGEHVVGIVEVGFGMSELLNRLDKRLNTGMALLLDNRRVSDAMLKDYRPTMETHQSFILAASRPEAGDWLKEGLLPATSENLPQNRLLAWKGHHFQLIASALNDYQSQTDPQASPLGTVLIWRDITDRIKRLEKDRSAVVVNTLAAWIFAQFFLLVLLYLLRREWARQLKQNTTAFENLLQHNAMLLNTAANGICGVDRNGRITFINRAALAMHGFRLEEVMGRNLHELLHFDDSIDHPSSEMSHLYMQTLEDGKPRESEEWLARRDGSCFPAQVAVTPIFDQGQKNGAVIVFHDITEQRNRQEALLRLATTDSLTGASNRRHFLDQLETELSRQRRHGGRASILMTDLDFFKHINDEYGHATGDIVLSHFVHIVRQTVRRSDIIGRLGGEEFAILLPGDGTEGARELAERLRRAFESNPAKVDNIDITCTVSIGISDLRTDDMTADAPMRRADEALYAAKAAGRNRTVLYDPAWQWAQPRPWDETTPALCATPPGGGI